MRRWGRFEKVDVVAKAKKPKDDTAPEQAASETRNDISENVTAGPKTEDISETKVEPSTEVETLAPHDVITDTDTPKEGSSTAATADETAPEEPAKDDAVKAPWSVSEPDAAEKTNDEQTEDASETRDVKDQAVLQHPLPVPAPAPRRSSFWPAVFGGVIAAMLGFIAGRGDMLDAYFPRADLPEPVDLTPLTEETAALTARVQDLENAPPAAAPDGDAITAGLDDVSSALEAMQSTLQAQTARIDALEARPEAGTTAPPVDNSAEIEALQSSIAALEARLAEQDAQASAEAARLLARAALTQVVTAVENGEAFEPALGALEEVAPVEVPDALRSAAAEGVPSMTTLRENFPDAARAALAAARADVPESEVAGIGGFLRRQLSARSVTPREGSDPDAVLSRAEAAVRSGDLETALTELAALPETSKSAMQTWLDGANARKEARDAAQALSDSLTVN